MDGIEARLLVATGRGCLRSAKDLFHYIELVGLHISLCRQSASIPRRRRQPRDVHCPREAGYWAHLSCGLPSH